MALTQKQQQHDRFMDISAAVSDALVEVAARFDISEDDLRVAAESDMNAAVDTATSALLKAYVLKHA